MPRAACQEIQLPPKLPLLWSPNTLYYSFPGVPRGSQPYLQRRRSTLEKRRAARDRQQRFALELTPKKAAGGPC